jgi:hypothetical protein
MAKIKAANNETPKKATIKSHSKQKIPIIKVHVPTNTKAASQ